MCLAGAYLDKSGECRAQQASEHHIPFRQGYEAHVSQGHYGFATHRDSLAYAVDFACEEGTPVVASRDGVVWSTRRDSNISCGTEECQDEANYVILDHGDGTFSTYYHLQHKGVVVEPGDQVCRGQLIGLCGDTGFATGPHLHFGVRGVHWRTIPIGLVELEEEPTSVVLTGGSYVSQNRRTSGCRETNYSRLGTDAFIHRGVQLYREIPTVVEEDHRKMIIEGRVVSGDRHVSIHRRPVGGGRWIDMCEEVEDDGSFSFEIDWPEQIFDKKYYFLMVTATSEECRSPGWPWAYRIRVRNAE